MQLDKGLFRRQPDCAWQTVDSEVVVVTPHTTQIHILSGVGAAVWQKLQDPKSLGEITQELVEEYEVSPGQLREDLTGFLSDLLAKEIVTRQ